ncbi:MAG: response regulator [Spirochaetia bacterium]|nr:response regulator [Spirochaetia bacterium]
MYNVMIVDDEEPVLDSFSYLLQKNSEFFSLCGKARSGYEAIEMVQKVHPDIIFMDIGMPGIDGLETIKELQGQYPEILYIISTAYERFDVAKRAVPLGVFEYLVKPISRGKFQETLEKAKDFLNQKKDKISSHVTELKKSFQTTAWEEKNFLSRITWKTLQNDEWARYKVLFKFPSDRGAVLLLQIYSEEKSEERDQQIVQEAYKNFITRIKYKYLCLSSDYLGKLLVFILEDDNSCRLKSICSHILESTVPKDAKYTLGIGTFRNYTELHISCNEAMQPFTSGDDLTARMDQEQNMMNELRKMAAGMESREMFSFSIAGQFADFEEFIFHTCSFSVAGGKMIQLFTLLIDDLLQSIGKGVTLKIPFDPVRDILTFTNREQFHLWAVRSMRILMDLNSEIRRENRPLPLRKALAYIHTEYAESVQLTSMAEICNVSPAYLSRLFSEHLQTNFVDYLTGVRLAHAQELLKNQDTTIKDVAGAVGYQDPNYFSKIFKKYKGISPTLYMREEELR